MDSSLTDFYTGTTNNHHSGATNSLPTRTSSALPTLLPCCFLANTQHQLHPTTSPFLSRHTLTYTTHKDGPIDSTMVSWLIKQPHSEPSIREPFLKTRTTKAWKVPSAGSPKNYKQASLNKYIPSHPTHYHEFQLKYLSQVSTLARSFSTHHPTRPWLSRPHLSSASVLLIKVTSYVSRFSSVKPTYTLMPSHISWHSLPCLVHSPFALQTSGKPNHVVQATNSVYTKPRASTPTPGAQHVPNHVPTLNQSLTTPFHESPTLYLIQVNHANL